MKKIFPGILICLLAFTGCKKQEFNTTSILTEVAQQSAFMLTEAENQHAIPRSVNPDDNTRWIQPDSGLDWTEGFWPGICWMLYQHTGDSLWQQGAIYAQDLFINHRFDSTTHDLGFIFNNSFGKAYRITGKKNYKEVMLDAANSLASRYNPNTGCIKSWDFGEENWTFPVIIDNMMNLELLFEAWKISGDETYKQIAVSHANTTKKNQYREDFGTFHVVDYDTVTGEVIKKFTHQGYADSTTWARGQAWGFYGFTMCFRYTGDSAYLKQADQIAGYFIDHMPDDFILPWDFNAPDTLIYVKDASATAIFASALIEFGTYMHNEKYISLAKNITEALSKSAYRAKIKTNNYFILKHSVGHFMVHSEVNVPIIYADYYYVESLLRLNLLAQGKELNVSLIK
ncbi:MAG: glycoside hydrolase family 88 protein [Bacteroidales bacterium]|nr:glycoside hydrolase family 88 protein [Bacteroidales bacterium]